jgi:hypothetical protein
VIFAFADGHRRIAISLMAGHLDFRGGLFDRGGLVRRLDGAKPDGFGGANETSRVSGTPAQDFRQVWGRAAFHLPPQKREKQAGAFARWHPFPSGCGKSARNKVLLQY